MKTGIRKLQLNPAWFLSEEVRMRSNNNDMTIDNKLLKTLLTFLLFIYIFIVSLSPLYFGFDTDVYWHIKTGEIIFNERSIPQSDPFAYTPKEPLREKFLMSSYWLADLVLYLFYKVGDFTGVVTLRALIVSVTALFVYLTIIKRGYLLTVPVLLLLVESIRAQSPKPNLFSYALIAAMIYFMEQYRSQRKGRYQIFVAIVMLLWANMHGTYIVGVGLLAVYIFSALLSGLWTWKRESAGSFFSLKIFDISLILTAAAAIVITLFTPSGIQAYLVSAKLYANPTHHEMAGLVAAHRSFFEFIGDSRYRDWSVVILCFFSALIFIFSFLNVTRKKAGLTEALLVVSLIILLLSAVRMKYFFIIAGIMVSAGKERYHMISFKTGKPLNNLVLTFLSILIVSLLYYNFPARHPGDMRETLSTNLRVSKFLLQNKIKGNMLNPANMGNLFILKLFPDYKVFFSTRYMNMNVNKDALDLFTATSEKDNEQRSFMNNYFFFLQMLNKRVDQDFTKEYWYNLIDKYEIDFIVGRITNPINGMIYPLFLKLMYNDNWKLIYVDGNSVIMLKDNGMNNEILEKYPPLDLSEMFSQIIKENQYRSTDFSHESLSFAFAMKGEYKMAENFAKSALESNSMRHIAKAVLIYIDLINNK